MREVGGGYGYSGEERRNVDRYHGAALPIDLR